MNLRVGINHAIEYDSDLLSDVILCKTSPYVSAFCVHCHGYAWATAVGLLVHADAGVGDCTTVERCFTVPCGSLDGYELIPVTA